MRQEALQHAPMTFSGFNDVFLTVLRTESGFLKQSPGACGQRWHVSWHSLWVRTQGKTLHSYGLSKRGEFLHSAAAMVQEMSTVRVTQ